MEIFIEKENKSITRSFDGPVKELLISLSINPETVIVVRNCEIVTEEDNVNNKDSLKILSVISGG